MTNPTKLASVIDAFTTNANGNAGSIKGAALTLSLPTANGQVLTGNTDGTTAWATGGGGSSLVFNGNGITGSVTPTTIAIGTNLSGSFSGSTLTLSATGSAGVPTLQQVTTAGAQTSVNTFFGAATGNSIGLAGNVNNSAPILAAVAATSGTPDANVSLFLNTVGRGTLNLCGQQANYLAVSSSAASNPFISVAGNATSMSLLHSAGGFVYVGPSAGGFVSIAGNNTGPAAISATNTNQGIGLMPMGTGATVLGNTASASGISITGGQTSSATMTSAGAGGTIDLYLHSKGSSSANYLGNDSINTKLKVSTGSDAAGTQAVFIGGYTPTQATSIDFVISTQNAGWFYPCRDSLSGISGGSQPKIALPTSAGGTVMGTGAVGQVIVSNANNGAPYWGTVYPAVLAYRLSAGINVDSTTDTTVTFDTQTINQGTHGITYSGGTFTAPSVGGIYAISYQAGWSANSTGARVTYLQVRGNAGRIGVNDVTANPDFPVYTGSTIWIAGGNDTLIYRVWQNSGTSLTFGGTAAAVPVGYTATIAFTRIG